VLLCAFAFYDGGKNCSGRWVIYLWIVCIFARPDPVLFDPVLLLKGDWKNYRDLHIEPDWLLLYKTDDANLWLVHTGTHSDIFGT
jgi:hypothetical protein